MICAVETNISYSVTNVSGINYQWSEMVPQFQGKEQILYP